MPERPERLAGGEPTTGKKISKKTTLLILGGVIAIGGIVYLMRKKRATEEPAVATEAGALTSQAFIPVTGENVAGMGSGGGGYSTGGTQEANSQLLEYIRLNNEKSEHQQETQAAFYNSLIEKLNTGGGPPTTNNYYGSTPAPPAPNSPTPPSAPKGAPTPTVPMNVVKCGNGCQGHEYPKGKNGKGTKITECQVKNSHGQCTWP